jgi:hypothetical protein
MLTLAKNQDGWSRIGYIGPQPVGRVLIQASYHVFDFVSSEMFVFRALMATGADVYNGNSLSVN